MLKSLIVAIALVGSATMVNAADLDPALGESATARHAPGNYVASVPPIGQSAKDRHAPGN